MALRERVEEGRHVAGLPKLGGARFVPRHRVLQGALAHAVRVVGFGELDVRHHALVLGALAGGQVVLRLRHLELPSIQRKQRLHGALAEGAAAGDDAAAVVLNGAGEDLRRGRRQPVHHHGQRAIPIHIRVRICLNVRVAPLHPHLHHRARLDEEPSEPLRLLQRAAAVVAQIHHDALDPFRLQLADQPAHVAGAASGVRVAAHAAEIRVERGHFDDADLAFDAAGLQREDALLGRLFLKQHGVARDVYQPGVRYRAIVTDHLQPHHGALGAADEGHHFVQAPAHDIHDHPALALPHADDAVRRLQAAVLVGRAGRHQAPHGGVLVLHFQHGADALQREGHVDVEVLGGARGEILGVRIVGAGEGVHIERERILAAHPGSLLQAVAVALLQCLLDFVKVSPVHGHAEHGRLQAPPPEIVHGRFAGRPIRVLAFDLQLLLAGEIEPVETCADEAQNVFKALRHPLLEQVEDLEGGAQVSPAQRFVQLVAVTRLKGLHVRAIEVRPARVQVLQILVEELRGEAIVQLARQEMMLAQLIDDGERGARMFGTRRHLHRLRRGVQRELLLVRGAGHQRDGRRQRQPAPAQPAGGRHGAIAHRRMSNLQGRAAPPRHEHANVPRAARRINRVGRAAAFRCHRNGDASSTA